jgi:uncharacterized protein (TIGR03067 family)
MTNRVAVIVLVAGLAAAARADEPASETAKKAMDAMQGTWAVLSLSSNGEDVPPETIATWQRIVKDTHVVWKDRGDTLLETDIKIDPSKLPMTLDSTIASGDAKGQTMLAIYELADDVLRVCFAPPGEPRPTAFGAASGSGLLMFTAKRLSR